MKKITLYLFIIVIAGYAVSEILYCGLRENKYGIFDKYNTIFLEKNNYETIIIGSSRAESHFSTRVIDSALHTNSYNIGIQGASLPFALDVFNAYLENSSFPKNVIFNIDHHINTCDNDTVFMFPRYFPYLENKTLYSALEKRDKRFFAFRYFPYYNLAYMGDAYFSGAIRGFLNKPGKYDLKYYKGYTSIMDIKWKYKAYYACDEDLMYNRIDSIADLCKKHHANLFLVVSPIYSKAADLILNRAALIQKLNSKAAANNITLLDYSDDAISKDSSFFADPYHLKEKGALLFTNELVKDLKKIW
ncbi:MAG: hypothetical protein ACXVNN_04205, partial [Bacteroidia bacterium]